MSVFGDLLRGFRQRARMSQSALAEAAKIDKSYVSMLESGKRSVTSRDLALTLAKVLRLSPDEVDQWLITAGYVSPRIQAMVARNGVSRLLEEFNPTDTGFDTDRE